MADLLLGLLVLVDCAFIVLHVWAGVPLDGSSAAEYFNYAQWLACGLGTFWLFSRQRDPLYFAWGCFFLYGLIDEAESLRGMIGTAIMRGLGWRSHLGFSRHDLGEIAAAGVLGAVLLGALAVAYLYSTHKEAKALTHRLLPWLAMLIFFAVFIDAVHARTDHATFSFWLGVIEEGGEMVVASLLLWTVATQCFELRNRAALRTEEGVKPSG